MGLSRRQVTGTAGHGDVGRRAFLRRAGIAGAVTAAFVGATDLAGLSPASAAVRRSSTSDALHAQTGSSRAGVNVQATTTCTFVRCGCGSNGLTCCPSGRCCYHCSGVCASGKFCFIRNGSSCPSSQVFSC